MNKPQSIRLRPVIQKLEELGLTGEIISIRTDGKTGTLIPDLKPGTSKTGPCKTKQIMTGNWVIDDARDYFKHVVLCVERPDGAFDIYTGRFIQLHQIDNSRRKIVEISDPVLVGMTYSIPMVFNGGKFSGKGVTYLSLPAVTLTKVTFPSRTYQEGQEQITMSSPDQALFSEDVRKNCAGTCVLTGVRARQRTEAAHIKPRHAGGEPDATNGLLLRRDIHTLFDNWLFSIEPNSLKAYFSPEVLAVDKDLLHLEGKQIDLTHLQMPINMEYLRYHWSEFYKRHRNPSIKKKTKKVS